MGPQGKEHLFLAGGEKIMLELTLEGEAVLSGIPGVAKSMYKGPWQWKAYHGDGIVPSLYCWSRKWEASMGSDWRGGMGETFWRLWMTDWGV